MMRHTKIVCTLGPASLRRETVAAMLRAGMDVARLNTSHGTIDEHIAALELVREVAGAEGKPVAVLMDLGGPKLRTGKTADGRPIDLSVGEEIRLTNDPVPVTEGLVSVEYPRLTEDVLAGEHVLLDDGNIELQVTHVSPDGLECRVVHGGLLGQRKGVSFPHSNLTLPAVTDRDRAALTAGVKAGVDLFALSFVRDASDVALCRNLIAEQGADTPIIATDSTG
jgi:pyruvate kinase